MTDLPQPVPVDKILDELNKLAKAPFPKEWEQSSVQANARPKLNDLTREEIAEIRRANERRVSHCAWCDKEMLMRSDQKFCSSKCRTASYHVGARRLQESRARAEEIWHCERAELVRENSQLRGEIAELKRQLGSDL